MRFDAYIPYIINHAENFARISSIFYIQTYTKKLGRFGIQMYINVSLSTYEQIKTILAKYFQ